MRIAQVTPVYPPERGGMGQVAREYVDRLRARGHAVDVFTAGHGDAGNDPPHVHRLPALLRVGNASLLPSLVGRLRPFDLIHLHYPFFGGAEPAVLGTLAASHQTLVVSYTMDARAPGLRGRVFDVHERVLLPRILRRADAVLVSSRDYAEHSALARVPGLLARVEEHPYGVDVERFHPGSDEDLRRAVGIDGNTPAILFVGVLDAAHHFKGLDVLLEALERLRSSAWHLVVVGGGPLQSEFQANAAARGLSARIHFAGSVSDEALPRYYRLADLHVLPSTGAGEAFGLVVLEAAASGIPTVASALPGVRTVVLDGDTGIHVAPGDPAALGDALRTLIDRPDLRQRLGRSARAHASTRFSWTPLIDRLEQTYEACAARRRQRAN